MAKVVSINVSAAKGVKKTSVSEASLIENCGIKGDAHAGSPVRQVSLLNIDDIRKTNLNAGDFAENISAEGIDLKNLPVGTRMRIGAAAVLEISQIGKKCHTRCTIYNEVGDCIMPKQGVFARVITGGRIAAGDEISVI